MPFSIFNLQQMIRVENKKLKNPKLKNDENFGFESLSHDTFQILLNANKQLRDVPQLFCGLSGKQPAQFKKHLLEAIQELNAKKFKEQAVIYRQDIQKYRNQKWYEHQQKSLSKPSFWDSLFGKFGNDIGFRLLQIQKKWQTQKDYAHYNSLALKHVAENILPVFENYVGLARVELQHNSNRLPRKILNAFKQYLIQLQNEIDKEKQKICWAMFGRLEVASKNCDLNAEDVTIELTEALKEIGVIKSSAQFPEPRRNLSTECFAFFHHFIETHGKQPLKNHISRLAWFRENENFITLQRLNHNLVVPKALVSFVPENPSFLSKLFGGVHFRYRFLMERLPLISRMRLLDKHAIVIDSLQEVSNHSMLKTLDDFENELLSEYQRSRNFKPNIIKQLFQRESTHFIKMWKKFLKSQLQEVLDKKIEFMHLLAQQVKTRLDFGLDAELLCSPDFIKFIRSLLDNIDHRCDQLAFDASASSHYVESKLILAQILNNNIRYHQDDRFQKQSEQETLKISSGISSQFSLGTREEDYVVTEKIEKAREFLEDYLQNKLPNKLRDPIFLSSFEEHSCLIKKHDIKDLKTLLKKAMEKCFVDLLQEFISLRAEDCSQHLPKFKEAEKLLLSRAPVCIRSRMASLSDLATKEQWFLWQIKCQSFLHSFEGSSIKQKPSEILHKTPDKLKGELVSYDSSVRFFNHRLSSDEQFTRKVSNHFITSCQL